MPALFFVLAAAMYFLYMLMTRAVLRRWTWERRSIVLGEEAWYMPPLLCILGLALAPVLGLALNASVRFAFFPGAPPADNTPALLPLAAVHLTCIAILVATALRAHGHPYRTLAPPDRRRVLKWAALPGSVSLITAVLLVTIGVAALPAGFMLIFVWAFIAGIINASAQQQQTAKSKRSTGYLLEETPLNNEMRTIFWPGPIIGSVRMIPRPGRAAEKAAAEKPGTRASARTPPPPTEFSTKFSRRFRWSRARAGVVERLAVVPIEFLHENDTTCITAALALRFLGWDRGYLRWHAAATPDEPERTPAAFAAAIARLDHYTLANSATPDELFAAYRRRVPLHLFLWEHAGAEKYEQSWSEIEAALNQ